MRKSVLFVFAALVRMELQCSEEARAGKVSHLNGSAYEFLRICARYEAPAHVRCVL